MVVWNVQKAKKKSIVAGLLWCYHLTGTADAMFGERAGLVVWSCCLRAAADIGTLRRPATVTLLAVLNYTVTADSGLRF